MGSMDHIGKVMGFKCLRIKSLGEIEMEIERINSGGLGFINEYSI